MTIKRNTNPLAAALGVAISLSLTLAAAAPFAEMPPLNDPPLKRVSPGKFLWIDLVTEQVDEASDFYAGLFGWRIESVSETPGDYAIMYNGDRKVGGLTRLMGAGDEALGPARWIGYISVADAATAIERVKANKGRIVVETVDLPNRGRHAVVVDTGGSAVGLLQSSTGDPPTRVAGHGDWGWSQLYAKNLSGTRKFYERVFRLDQTVDKRSGQYGSYFLVNSGDALSGLSEPPEDAKNIVGWVGFIRVQNVGKTIAEAEKLGGRLLLGPSRILPGNTYAVLEDSVGGVFGIFSVLEDSSPE